MLINRGRGRQRWIETEEFKREILDNRTKRKKKRKGSEGKKKETEDYV